MKKGLLHLFFALLLLPVLLKAQDYQGFNNSNYAGVNGIFLQPACIVDSRYIVDINLVATDINFQNNYVALKWKTLKNDYNPNLNFQNTYLYTNDNSNNKYVYLKANVQLPSVSFNINRKNSLAFFIRERTEVNVDGISEDLAKQIWNSLKYQPLWNQGLTNQGLSIQLQAWMEYGFTYGREIFNLDGGRQYLKAAITFKLEQGLGSAYLYAPNLSYNFKNNDTLSIDNSKFDYGQSSNLGPNSSSDFNFNFISNPTVGFDMGVVYEWRPDIDKFIADKGKDEGKPRRDKNKYKLKLGFSLLDIGNLKYTKGGVSADFNANMYQHNIQNFKPNSQNTFNDSILNLYGFSTTDRRTYRMNLPTAMSFQADYDIWRGFYANFTAYGSFEQKNTISKLYDQSTFSITPRFEQKWFDFGMPISYNTDNQFQLGAYFRFGVLVIGTNNFLPAFQNNIYGANAYVALKIPIPYGKPRDKKMHLVKIVDTDHDGVPDNIDKCPTIPGPKENHGCPWPDMDHDGVPDKDDTCPTVAGPVENHGCPWPDRDSDGVLDKDDSCPTIAGPVENHGCPWPDRDHDGVPDKDDLCPDVFGPVENHGCPWPDTDGDGVLDKDDSCPTVAGPVENHGCPWPDSDGDGVPDKDDSCPHTPGPVSNHGCPVLAKAEARIVKQAFDNLLFITGKSIIRTTSYPSLDALAKLVNSKPEARLIISGYTDNTGTPELNIKLSKDRADAVLEYLVKRGVDMGKIEVHYYGAANPIADNSTAAGRAKNRRVEMTMTYK